MQFLLHDQFLVFHMSQMLAQKKGENEPSYAVLYRMSAGEEE